MITPDDPLVYSADLIAELEEARDRDWPTLRIVDERGASYQLLGVRHEGAAVLVIRPDTPSS